MELRYFITIASCGLFGASLHGASELTIIYRTERLKRNYLVALVSRGISGAAISLLIFLSIRGFLVVPNLDPGQLNPYGLGTVSVFSGLFSRVIIDKLFVAVNALLGHQSNLEKEIDQIGRTIGVSTLDNYRGYFYFEIFDRKYSGREPTALDSPYLKPGDYMLVVWFYPLLADRGAYEEIEVVNGRDVETVTFSVEPKGDKVRFEPARASLEFGVRSSSRRQEFYFYITEQTPLYRCWIEISQKSRLINVMSLGEEPDEVQGETGYSS
jgi:hypothetical protein